MGKVNSILFIFFAVTISCSTVVFLSANQTKSKFLLHQNLPRVKEY